MTIDNSLTTMIEMAIPKQPLEVELICGIICSDKIPLAEIHALLEEKIGKISIVSEAWAFDQTEYYKPQMGEGLVRQFVAFEQTVSPDVLARTKCLTNDMEDFFAEKYTDVSSRPVNLDPGYLTEANLILASMKAFSHRIYLSDGVYGEVTLLYHKGQWESLKWTFPDYASGRYDEFFNEARDALRLRIKGVSK